MFCELASKARLNCHYCEDSPYSYVPKCGREWNGNWKNLKFSQSHFKSYSEKFNQIMLVVVIIFRGRRQAKIIPSYKYIHRLRTFSNEIFKLWNEILSHKEDFIHTTNATTTFSQLKQFKNEFLISTKIHDEVLPLFSHLHAWEFSDILVLHLLDFALTLTRSLPILLIFCRHHRFIPSFHFAHTATLAL